jgi:hypothetical protein
MAEDRNTQAYIKAAMGNTWRPSSAAVGSQPRWELDNNPLYHPVNVGARRYLPGYAR